MKKLLVTLTFLAWIMMASGGRPLAASDIVLPSSSVVNAVLVSTKTVDLDLNALKADLLSVQVTYSSAVASAITFGDGTPGAGSITVASLTGLTTTHATNNITIASNSYLTGAVLYVNNTALKEGVHWTKAAVASNTAISLCDKLNRSYGNLFISTRIGAVIYSTAVVSGTAGNAYSLWSSTPAGLLCNTANFAGGKDNAVITVANVPLQANREWVVGTDETATARNISAAILASTKLNNVMTSTHTAGVVTATATVAGAQSNYQITSSTPTAISVVSFAGGQDADLTVTTPPGKTGGFFNFGMIFPGSSSRQPNTINEAPTNIGVGSQLLYGKTTGTSPGLLVDKTTYYATNLTATSFQLSDTSTGAVAGIAVTIATHTTAGGGTFTLTPLALSGTPIFKLQKSNDGTNFQDVYVSTSTLLAPFATTITFASPHASGTEIWDLGEVLFRYLRFAYYGALQGGTHINYVVNGKRK